MISTQISLAFIWTAVMLVYLLGDVLRVFSGDSEKGDTMSAIRKMGQPAWLGISVLMVLPIVMIVATVVMPYEINRWINIIMAGFWFAFNLVGITSYEGWYDRFLLIVSLAFNVLTIVLAWNWLA